MPQVNSPALPIGLGARSTPDQTSTSVYDPHSTQAFDVGEQVMSREDNTVGRESEYVINFSVVVKL